MQRAFALLFFYDTYVKWVFSDCVTSNVAIFELINQGRISKIEA